MSVATRGSDAVLEVQANVEAMQSTLVDVADKIWKLAELSLEEEESSGLFIDTLKEHGFTIDSVGTSNIPTAFTASYGSGSPVDRCHDRIRCAAGSRE